MKTIIAFLFFALLAPIALAANPVAGGGGGAFGESEETLGDETKFCIGADCDYWMIYNATGTRWELWTTDGDGGGTDGLVAYIPDGSDDLHIYESAGATLHARDIQEVVRLTSLSNAGISFRMGGNNSGSVTPFVFDDNNYQMTHTNGVRAFVALEPDVNQSGSAGYNILFVNLTETATGSGVHNFLRFFSGSDVYQVTKGGAHIYGKQAVTIADSGDGSAAAATLTPTSSYIELTCSDADGCDVTLGESGPVEGFLTTVVNVSANVCNFADTAGVSEIAGVFAAGQYDVLELLYDGSTWVERERSDN